MIKMLALAQKVNYYSMKDEVRDYARVLYMNYRARLKHDGIPKWNEASAIVKREFIREAKQELGY